MKMLDVEKEFAVRNLQLYLSVSEAKLFRDELNRLIAAPEANEHAHILGDDMGPEFSFSIVTETKLNHIESYTPLEQRILRGESGGA